MALVKHILEGKGDEVWSVAPNSTVYDALVMMAVKNVGALMVKDGDDFVGVFSERDYARKIILKGKTSLNTPLREIMTRETITVHPDTTIEESMELMTHWHIRHLPVMDEGRLVGMVSMRDIVEAIISLKDKTIEDLETYILSEGYAQ